MSESEIESLRSRVRELCNLVRKVHKAKGRYHTQLAMCDLFDSVGLPSERPEKDGASAREHNRPDDTEGGKI